MATQEWPLIVFTVVMQLAVGSFVILGGVHFFASRRNGIAEADKLSDRALLAIGPLVVLALIVTLLHLGNPLKAPGAITNLGTSWLSREIILGVTFAVGGALFAFMQWRKISTASIRNVLELLVAAVGLVLVFAMASVYQLRTVPAWNSLATPVSFFITTVLLGTLAIGAAFVIGYQRLQARGLDSEKVQFGILATTLRWVALISLVMVGLQFVVIPVYLASLAANASPAAASSIGIIINENGWLFAIRLLLIFLGAGIFSIFIYQSASSDNKIRIVSNLALLAFVLVLVSEVLGRYLFYASMVRVGI